jgi:hypothetical protein
MEPGTAAPPPFYSEDRRPTDVAATNPTTFEQADQALPVRETVMKSAVPLR